MRITKSLLLAVDHADREAQKIIGLHAPDRGRCRRCQQLWPCDAARMASEATELLAELATVTVPEPEPQPTVEAIDLSANTPVVRAWRVARSAADEAYRRVRELVPVDEEGELPRIDTAGLTDEQRRALVDLAAAEGEQVRRALAMLEQARPAWAGVSGGHGGW